MHWCKLHPPPTLADFFRRLENKHRASHKLIDWKCFHLSLEDKNKLGKLGCKCSDSKWYHRAVIWNIGRENAKIFKFCIIPAIMHTISTFSERIVIPMLSWIL